MDEGYSVTVIQLTNRQLGFYPNRNSKIYLLIFAFTYACLYFGFYWFTKKITYEPHLLSFYISSFFGLSFSALVWSTESIHSNLHFPKKTDKDGKNKEKKVREFWRSVLDTQNKIFIERAKTEKENYAVVSLPATNFEAKLSTKMTWCDITLFEKNHEGHVTHLEGMPAFLFLKD